MCNVRCKLLPSERTLFICWIPLETGEGLWKILTRRCQNVYGPHAVVCITCTCFPFHNQSIACYKCGIPLRTKSIKAIVISILSLILFFQKLFILVKQHTLLNKHSKKNCQAKRAQFDKILDYSKYLWNMISQSRFPSFVLLCSKEPNLSPLKMFKRKTAFPFSTKDGVTY